MTNSEHSDAIRRLGSRRGFTIIEALVATAVFALAMTSIMGVFLAVTRINERGNNVRRIEQNARFISEFITREFRNGRLDYSAYGGSVPSPYATTLHYITRDGTTASFELIGDELYFHQQGETSSKMNSENTDIPNLRFYIRPLAESTSTVQPYVVMVMGIESKAERDLGHLDIQTTISSRHYPR